MSKSCKLHGQGTSFSLLVILLACQPNDQVQPSKPPTDIPRAINFSTALPPEMLTVRPSPTPPLKVTPSSTPAIVVTQMPSGTPNPVISWDNLEKLTVLHTFGPNQDNAKIGGVIPSPDGRLLAVFGGSSNFELRDAVSGARVRTFATGDNVDVATVRFSPDGQFLAASPDGYPNQSSIQLWSARNGQLLWSHTVGVQSESALAFSPDGKLLASGSPFRSDVQLWGVSSGQITQRLEDPSNGIGDLAFNPANSRQLAVSSDSNTKLWDVVTTQMQTIEPLPGSAFARHVAFSPDGKRLAIGYMEQTVEMLDLASGQRQVFHTSYVSDLALSPLDGGRIFATIEYLDKGRDFYLAFRDSLGTADKGFQYLFDPPNKDETFNSLSFTADGRFVITAAYREQSRASVVYVWGIPP